MISLPITVGWAFSFSLTFLVVVVALFVIRLLPVNCYLVAWCLVVLQKLKQESFSVGNSGFCKCLTFGGVYFPERNRNGTELP